MDRFIEYSMPEVKKNDVNLKSNMDRFIVNLYVFMSMLRAI